MIKKNKQNQELIKMKSDPRLNKSKNSDIADLVSTEYKFNIIQATVQDI